MGEMRAPEKSAEIEIRYLGLARLVVGKERDSVPWTGRGTLYELLRILCERYGKDFQSSVLTMHGTLQNYVEIEVNDTDVEELQGLGTFINPSSRVKFIFNVPSLAGG